MSRRSRFVLPESVRLPLSDGDWIEVKRKLTSGELRRMQGAGFVYARDPEKPEGYTVEIDNHRLSTARVATYLVDWSFVDDQDKPVKLLDDPRGRLQQIDALDPDTLDEIDKAIDAHLEAQAKEKESPLAAGADVSLSSSWNVSAGPSEITTMPTPIS